MQRSHKLEQCLRWFAGPIAVNCQRQLISGIQLKAEEARLQKRLDGVTDDANYPEHLIGLSGL